MLRMNINDAVKCGNVSYIMAHLDQIHEKEDRGWTPIMNSIMCDNYWLTKLLLDHGANPSDALSLSILHRNLKVAELLLQYGADPNLPKDSNYSWIIGGDHLWYPIDSIYHTFDICRESLELLFKYNAYPYTPFYYTQFYTSHIDKTFWESVKKRYNPVGFALSHLSTQELLAILEALCSGAECLNHNKKWTLITTIKHFKK